MLLHVTQQLRDRDAALAALRAELEAAGTTVVEAVTVPVAMSVSSPISLCCRASRAGGRGDPLPLPQTYGAGSARASVRPPKQFDGPR